MQLTSQYAALGASQLASSERVTQLASGKLSQADGSAHARVQTPQAQTNPGPQSDRLSLHR
jgi:hypothetical protein